MNFKLDAGLIPFKLSLCVFFFSLTLALFLSLFLSLITLYSNILRNTEVITESGICIRDVDEACIERLIEGRTFTLSLGRVIEAVYDYI